MARLLLIEDHPALVETLTDFLEGAGHTVSAEQRGRNGIQAVLRNAPDVIILDLGLPDVDGVQVCRILREEHQLHTPILMLTARDTLSDKLEGFDAGAHDYLCKPFAPAELEARIRVLAAREAYSREDILECAGVRLDPSAHTVERDGIPLSPSPTGFKLLKILMQRSPDFVERDSLVREVWGDFPPGSDALRTHLAQLRKLLDKPFPTALIETRYAVGCRFRDPEADDA